MSEINRQSSVEDIPVLARGAPRAPARRRQGQRQPTRHSNNGDPNYQPWIIHRGQVMERAHVLQGPDLQPIRRVPREAYEFYMMLENLRMQVEDEERERALEYVNPFEWLSTVVTDVVAALCSDTSTLLRHVWQPIKMCLGLASNAAFKLAKILLKSFLKTFYPILFSPQEMFKTVNRRLKEKVEGMNLEFSEHTIHINEGATRLVLHRVRRRGRVDERRYPVFIQHGMLNSSADFLLEKKSLGIMAAKAGYDVWLGNFRGNAFSGNHFDREPDEAIFNESYWNFTFYHHGAEDLKAMVQEVVRITGHGKVHFIGHSMGTTALFVMLNACPGMNDAIATANLMAPVYDLARIQGIPAAMVKLRLAWLFVWIQEQLGIFTFFFPRIVHGYALMASVSLFHLGYFNFSFDSIKDILAFGPSGCSTKTMLHCLQCHQEESFRPYQQGRNEAVENPLSNVTCPVTIWYSDGDWTAARENIAKMVSLLPRVKDVNRVTSSFHFGHLDFLWGRSEEMNSEIIRKLELPGGSTTKEAAIEHLTKTYACPQVFYIALGYAEGLRSALLCVFDFLADKLIRNWGIRFIAVTWWNEIFKLIVRFFFFVVTAPLPYVFRLVCMPLQIFYRYT